MNDFFLADDLSGALEVAAAFHQAGRPAVVTWSISGWDGCGPDDVVGFNTETRNENPAAAAARVAQALAHGRERGRRLHFKKIDSTMRGPVGAELAALAEARPDLTILFTPANPHAGRTVRDGVLLVHGVPVAETEFGRDPVSPVSESSIRAAVPAAARERVIALDATTDADLLRGLMAREAAATPWMAVGSGALARVLAPRLAPSLVVSRKPTEQRPMKPGPVLFVCGSAHPANRAQAATLTRERATTVVEVHGSDPAQAARAAVAAIRSTGAAGLHMAPRSVAGAAPDSRAALAAMVEAACVTIRETGVRRILATGGETARALCDALEIRALRVLGDVEPGLVLAGAENAAGEWRLAIKPGGFGTEACWVRAADALSQA